MTVKQKQTIVAIVGIIAIVAVDIHLYAKQESWEKEKIELDIVRKKELIRLEIARKEVLSRIGEMVLVEGGSFHMGSNDGESSEKPIHRVTVNSFYIGRTEVTVKEYKAYCQATGTSMPSQPSWGWNDSDPVVNVSWNDAQGYCKWAKVRLPTEVEWEYAASGGNKSKGYKYSGSDNLDNVAWNGSNSVHQVGTKQANELGLYDMSGNVWEWCSDWYGDYKSNDQRDPKGAESGSYRVLRGGSWLSYGYDCRVANRGRNDPDYRYYSNGFRVVLD